MNLATSRFSDKDFHKTNNFYQQESTSRSRFQFTKNEVPKVSYLTTRNSFVTNNHKSQESLRNNYQDNKDSFDNRKLPSLNKGQVPRRASREITSTKEFEDRATKILAEMRRQRRSMKLESVSSANNSIR